MKSTSAGVALLLLVLCHSSACSGTNSSEITQTCWKCSGSDCDEPTSSLCSQYSSDDGCYTLFNYYTNVTAMGCQSDLDEEFVNENFHSLLFCNESNCNSLDNLPVPHKCLYCHAKEDSNCGTAPSKITLIGNCGVLPYSSCQTSIKDGYVYRSCLSSLEREDLEACLAGTGNCTVCTGDLCNNKIYTAGG
ncbi:uncharacterized protein LOC119551904 [Drosophila subpulchrella]|uniref:uncharacterized protein LOC119551765 n=1 Tax=Drosophila subpulchrella TaxID=1486046 RepID=UPI0018A189B1|nr:uncharacterized protein LOC119551765 [Drosophila subpulchrella]XP_037717446.1 uncharacterized protein LOC119551904 [Drosophila subpulchrella]